MCEDAEMCLELHRFMDFYDPVLNVVTRGRVDPLLQELLAIFGLGVNSDVYTLLSLLLLAAGVFFLVRVLGGDRVAAFAGAIWTGALVAALSGRSPAHADLHWLPILAAALIECRKSDRWWCRGLAAVAIGEWSFGGGALGVAGALSAVVFAACVPIERRNSPERSREGLFFLAAGFLAVLLSFLFLVTPPMPDYPGDARLTEITPLTFVSIPILGPALFPNPVVYDGYREVLNSQVFLGSLAAFVLLALTPAAGRLRDSQWRSLKGGLWIVLATIGLVCVEQFVPAAYRDATPFAALVRLVPGLALQPFPWVLLPVGAMFSIPLVVAVLDRRRLLAGAVASAALAALVLGAACPGAIVPISGGFDRIASSAESERSPSGYLVARLGFWAADPVQRELRGHLALLKSNEDYVASVEASANASEARRAIDGNERTRWSTGRPQQPGDWFVMRFDRPLEVLRVELSVGQYRADFPRGLRVESSEDGVNFAPVFSQPVWAGPWKTTPLGYPYFGSQSEVTVDFAVTVKTRALRFVQAGEEATYDWTIAEVKLYAAPVVP